MNQVIALLGTHKSSTIMGIALLGGAVTSVLLEQATWKQAAAYFVSGCVAILLKQENGGPVTVTGPATVQADTASVQPAPGSTTTIR